MTVLKFLVKDLEITLNGGEVVMMQVLDLGQVVAGNFCGGLLGYFGADVIKVGRWQIKPLLLG